jgi:molybdopterin biosynthesis enzyme
MTGTQRLTAALTPLDAALAEVLDRVQPVEPIDALLAEAIGCIAAGMAPLAAGLPSANVAVTDGWAMRARELAGASSYAPLPLPKAPVWVEAGDQLPADCDCVIDENAVERVGSLFQVVTEAIPGDGIRRAGEEFAQGQALAGAGRRITPADVMIARAARHERLRVRRPHVRVIDVPARDGRSISAEFVADSARAAGARVTLIKADARDASAVAAAMRDDTGDLMLLVGGSGVGRSDAAVDALASCGQVFVHGLALRPGRTTAIGRIGRAPVVVIPGAPAHALAVWCAVAEPLLDRLTGCAERRSITRPLARKIASAIGLAELVVLKAVDGNWLPLAVGDLPLARASAADAWLVVPGESEGYAAGTNVAALPLGNAA